MKCYTVQKLSAWEEAKQKGFLTGNKTYINEEWFLSYYLWMMKQMAKRIKNYHNEFPIWVWLDASNICFSELLDDEWVLLEIDISEEQILLSNFEAWHFMLNDWNFDEENKTICKDQSWEYIFDKEKMEKLDYGFEKEDLQGTIGEIDCKNIKVLKYIVNRYNIS